ncbi:MAG: FlgD immunoglobulin-like domain containing protein, partial [Chloroflexota bacterium]
MTTIALIVASLASLVATPVVAASPQAETVVLSTVGSPFNPNGDGRRERVGIKLELGAAATVTLTVRDFNGRRLRTLVRDAQLGSGEHAWTWNGRDGGARRVPPGPYRVRATVTTSSGATVKRLRW